MRDELRRDVLIEDDALSDAGRGRRAIAGPRPREGLLSPACWRELLFALGRPARIVPLRSRNTPGHACPGRPTSAVIWREFREERAVAVRIAWVVWACWAASWATAWAAGPLVPGTGVKSTICGDDFEDEEWEFYLNLPKSSSEQDKQTRQPYGRSKNRRWAEGAHRGTPDVVKTVDTPPGGLPGSQRSLLIGTLNSGIPRRPSGSGEQDDLFLNVATQSGSYLPTSWSPSVTVRVFVPPLDQWDGRVGSSLGFRADVRGRRDGEMEPFWPGIFFQYAKKRDGTPYSFLQIRSNERGQDIRGPEVTEFGWWTLGMSFSRDGAVHYYAKPGVEELTAEDRLASHICYGMRCERVEAIFFDVFSRDNTRDWGTPWIIDDPTVYHMPLQQAATPRTTTSGGTLRRSK